MLTSALRSGGLSTTSVAEATPSRSPGVSSTAFRAQSPNLRFASLMDMDFAVSCPLVRRWRLVSGFCSSTRTFVPCFLQAPPRGGSPCIITRPYLHQVGQRTFTSKLLSMPSTHRHRGGGHPPTPATPPCVRVRTRRFELVTLASIDQRWKSERGEVSIGKPHREGFGPGQIPGAESAASRVLGQSRANPQC